MIQASCFHFLGRKAGNLFFPFLYLAMVSMAWNTSRKAGLEKIPAWLLTLSVALTPMLLSPGCGAVDSGYGELFVVYALTAIGSGLAASGHGNLFWGALILPLVKPEGFIYGIILWLCLLFFGDKKSLLFGAGGFTSGLLLWLPLWFSLSKPGTHYSVLPFLAILVPAFLLSVLSKLVILRVNPGKILLGLSFLAFLALIFLVILLLKGKILATGSVLAVNFMARLDNIFTNIKYLPKILHYWVMYLTFIRKYGFLYIILAALLLAPREVSGKCPSPPLALFIVFLLISAILPFLAVPTKDIDFHLKSRMDRLFLHWSGATWMLVGVWMKPLLSRMTEKYFPGKKP